MEETIAKNFNSLRNYENFVALYPGLNKRAFKDNAFSKRFEARESHIRIYTMESIYFLDEEVYRITKEFYKGKEMESAFGRIKGGERIGIHKTFQGGKISDEGEYAYGGRQIGKWKFYNEGSLSYVQDF
jgi:hypothetical protein